MLVHSVHAQQLDHSLVFDDFSYDGVLYDSRPHVRSGPTGTLYGRNTWTNGDSTWRERVWYRYDWWDRYSDENVFRNAEVDTTVGTWGRGLAFRFPPGEYLAKGPDGRSNKPPQVVSGFAYRTGTWVARVNFDDLKVGSNRGGPDPNLVQAFWTHSPNLTQTQKSDKVVWSSTIWDEIDYEFTNYFKIPDAPTPDGWPYLATGTVVNGRPNGEGGYVVPIRAPSQPDGHRGGNFTCKYTYLEDGTYEASDLRDVATVLGPAACGDILGGDALTPKAPSRAEYTPKHVDDPFVWLVIRFDGNAHTFQAVAEGEWGRIDMKRRYDRHPVSQPMSVYFSQNLKPAHLKRTREMIVDWFYYTPDTSLPLADVREDVAAAREANIARLNTTGDRLTSPYKLTCTDPDGPSKPNVETEPCDWPYQKPTNAYEVTIDEPRRIENNQWQWAASLSPRQGVYRVDWSYRIRNREGRVTQRETSTWDDFKFTTPSNLECEARMTVTATFTAIHPARFEGEQATGRVVRNGPSCQNDS
jgi:hypothetical protein